jgi:hypothetical protein
MASSITAAVGSYESGATNLSADIRTVQELLTQAAKKLNTAAFNPGGVDGKIGKPGSKSNTVKAIVAFQKQQVGMGRPDERIDVNGSTWKKLVAVVGGGAAPKPPAGAGGGGGRGGGGGSVAPPPRSRRPGRSAWSPSPCRTAG